jgi:hypothetical protein
VPRGPGDFPTDTDTDTNTDESIETPEVPRGPGDFPNDTDTDTVTDENAMTGVALTGLTGAMASALVAASFSKRNRRDFNKVITGEDPNDTQ